jgi:mRNA interferase MazF
MGKFIKGDVVILPFPFSDLTSTKKRPALVVATMLGDDIILAQITSKAVSDTYSIEITSSDFSSGSLNQNSLVRPNRLFTADSNIVSYKAGCIKFPKLQEVINKIIEILNS